MVSFVLPKLAIDSKRKMIMIKHVSIYHDGSFAFDRRVRKNWRDIYFLMLTRPGHFFLYLSVAVPVVKNWLTRYQMKDMDIIFHMVPHKPM